MIMSTIVPFVKAALPLITRRNFGSCYVLLSNATDPIQQLFVDKIREFKGKINDKNFLKENPGLQTEIDKEVGRLKRQYGGSNPEELTQFPKVKIEEPKLDPQL